MCEAKRRVSLRGEVVKDTLFDPGVVQPRDLTRPIGCEAIDQHQPLVGERDRIQALADHALFVSGDDCRGEAHLTSWRTAVRHALGVFRNRPSLTSAWMMRLYAGPLKRSW